MPCMCGADDCPRCHPQNGQYVGKTWLYLAESDDPDADLQAAEDAEEDDAVDRYMDSLEDGFDDRRFDP
jgi:hypothetical protein